MDWELASQRQFVAEWRDRQILDACALFNREAKTAREAFEAYIKGSRLYDSTWDASEFVRTRIDRLLYKTMPAQLAQFFEDAARELRALDPHFEALGEALRRDNAIVLPQARQPELTEPPVLQKTEAPQPASGDRGKGRFGRVGEKLGKTARQVGRTAKRASDKLQNWTGLRDRLRNIAAEHIQQQWMTGTPGAEVDPRPVLSQVIAIIDEVAYTARSGLT